MRDGVKLRCGLLHLFESARGKTEKQFYEENIELIKYADEIALDTVWTQNIISLTMVLCRLPKFLAHT